jgi:ATP-binding cassette, subfamily F, member 3
MSQIVLSRVGVEFGGNPIFEDVSFTVSRGDRWGIVGRNGTGKTTLFQVITGKLEPSSGMITRAGGPRFTLLDQLRDFSGAASVWDAAAEPFAELAALEHSLHEQALRLGELGENGPPELLARYDRDLERFAREGGYEMQSRVDAVLHGLGFDPVFTRSQPVTQLSGGEAGRIALARQLVAPADVLLLDEPTNHLDLDTTRWLEEYLAALNATVLVISHDRAFLQAVCDHVLHFEGGTALPYQGRYDSFLRQHAERQLSQTRAFEVQQKTIAADEDYIRRNIAGQNSRQAKGRRTRLARVDRLTPPPSDTDRMALRLEPNERGGDQVMVARDARIAVGDRVLIDDFTGRITRGDVIGLVGANGTGKSTLLRALVGMHPVAAGELRIGSSINAAYYRQDLTQVPLGKSLFDIVHDLRPLWGRGAVQSHLGRFGFSGDSVRRVADSLSGGERARVALALLMLAHANFLLLDEPTNHLDVESIEALEDALSDFDGSVLLVSHDRALLRNLATRVWSLEDQHITEYPAGFAEWEAWRAERAAERARAERADADIRNQRTREDARKREAQDRTERNATRSLRAAVQTAEAEVHRLEARIAELKEWLMDPELYTSGAGAQQAHAWNTELQRLEADLLEAISRWTMAVDAESN